MADESRGPDERLREFMIRDRTSSVQELERPAHEVRSETEEAAKRAYGGDLAEGSQPPEAKEVYGDPDKVEVREGVAVTPQHMLRDRPTWDNDLQNEVQLEKERAETAQGQKGKG